MTSIDEFWCFDGHDAVGSKRPKYSYSFNLSLISHPYYIVCNHGKGI